MSVESEVLPSKWMPTNLGWKGSFWKNLSNMTIMRLNPHWHIEKADDGSYDVEDFLLEKKFKVSPRIEANEDSCLISFDTAGFNIEAKTSENGTNTELRYNVLDETLLTKDNISKTIEYWLPSLREYYRLHESDSFKHKFWRTFMDKVMLTMNPSQRRICSMIFKITILEAIVILVLGIGWFFYGG